MSKTMQGTHSVWTLDPAHTVVELEVKHMMITTVRGRFATVQGEIEIDQANPDRTRVEVVIDAGSIDTRNEQRDTHLRSADFLSVEEHGEITFRSTRVEGAYGRPGDAFRVVGDLTIRGVTREVVLEAAYEGEAKDPWGGTRAGFTATTEVDRRDFGLTWNQALETGGVLVAHKVRIRLDIQAVQQARLDAAA
jgi:polyisoprenoid-binding protein YceI